MEEERPLEGKRKGRIILWRPSSLPFHLFRRPTTIVARLLVLFLAARRRAGSTILEHFQTLFIIIVNCTIVDDGVGGVLVISISSRSSGSMSEPRRSLFRRAARVEITFQAIRDDVCASTVVQLPQICAPHPSRVELVEQSSNINPPATIELTIFFQWPRKAHHNQRRQP